MLCPLLSCSWLLCQMLYVVNYHVKCKIVVDRVLFWPRSWSCQSPSGKRSFLGLASPCYHKHDMTWHWGLKTWDPMWSGKSQCPCSQQLRLHRLTSSGLGGLGTPCEVALRGICITNQCWIGIIFFGTIWVLLMRLLHFFKKHGTDVS